MVCQKNGTKYILVPVAAPHNSVGHGQWAYPIPFLLVCCVIPVPENQGANARFPMPAKIP